MMVRKLAAKYLPWLDVIFFFFFWHPGRRHRPNKLSEAILTVQRQKDGWKKTLPAYDILLKVTGTTYEVPVLDKVEKMASTGVPGPYAI